MAVAVWPPAPPLRRRADGSVALLAVAVLVLSIVGRGTSFVSPPATRNALPVALRGVQVAAPPADDDSISTLTAVAATATAAALAARALKRTPTRDRSPGAPGAARAAAVPTGLGGMVLAAAPASQAPVAGVSANTAGEDGRSSDVAMRGGSPEVGSGRRARLGIAGRVCMLTGKQRKKTFYRTYSEKKNKRWTRPNLFWKRLWWEREQKWVRLLVSARAIRQVDVFGLEEMCRRAGLDLYAWCRPHWMPGSRQPLCLKIGWSPKALRDKKYWPDYIGKLNQGAALADTMPEPKKLASAQARLWPWKVGKPRRLDQEKMVTAGPADK